MNPYIPWNISYLNTMLEHIKGNIGAAVSVGILLFAVGFAVSVVVMVVRKFIG